jgi:hypothetical protein
LNVLDCALSESKTSRTWSYGLQGLEASVRDSKSHVETAEISPINEGFLPLGDQWNRSSLRAAPNSIRLKNVERPVQNASTTPCKTSTSTSAAVTTTVHRFNNTVYRRGKRSLNDPDGEALSDQEPVVEASDMGNFMEINADDALSNQFDLASQTVDGSGPSMSLPKDTIQ